MKVVAVLLGPAGVGLIGLYQATMGLVGTASGLGIRLSGVREVAAAAGDEDARAAGPTIRVLRAVCWITGLLGWALAALFSEVISEAVFGNREHARAIALLGGTLLLSSVSGGQTALLQGMRRIGDLARVNIVSMLINTVVTIGGYAWLGMVGIVPVLVANAAISLSVSWWYARKVEVPHAEVELKEGIASTKRLATLGAAFMWGSLLALGVDLFARATVTRELGVDAAGFYQAAWALSGMFAGFVLQAMAADYYPRLTGMIHEPEQAIRLVNEQIEIGILLALPGLLATLAFAPYVIRLIFTEEFLAAAALLPWFLLGVFGRVVTWPLGFIQHAKGAARWFFATQTIFASLHVLLLVMLVPRFGLIGTAYAFAILYFLYLPIMRWVAGRLLGFQWSGEVKRLAGISGIAVLAALALDLSVGAGPATVINGLIALVAGLACLRGLSARLGPTHALVRACKQIPGISRVVTVNLK